MCENLGMFIIEENIVYLHGLGQKLEVAKENARAAFSLPSWNTSGKMEENFQCFIAFGQGQAHLCLS